MIDDADVPLLFALVIASAVVAAPSVGVIVEMAAASAAIGATGCAALALLRHACRSCRRTLVARTP